MGVSASLLSRTSLSVQHMLADSAAESIRILPGVPTIVVKLNYDISGYGDDELELGI